MPDRDDELKKLSEDVSKTLKEAWDAKNQILQDAVSQFARLVSYIRSEERVDADRMKEITKIWEMTKLHDKAIFGDRMDPELHPGLVHQMIALQQSILTNRKLHWAVLGGVGTLILKQAWEVIFGHKVP